MLLVLLPLWEGYGAAMRPLVASRCTVAGEGFALVHWGLQLGRGSCCTANSDAGY